MVVNRLDGDFFSQMIYQGGNLLKANAHRVDSLNVFPVPDGDTGTNMNLTFTSGVEELARQSPVRIDQAASALARGLLMGARGNSGVILSQLFRGFEKAVHGKAEIGAKEFADGLKAGVDTAYQAVMKPVEGTILTVAREAAETAVRTARATDNLLAVMEKTYEQAQATLNRTPEILPVLKEVGVVDSGGQGLVYIYEGFLRVLRGEKPTVTEPPESDPAAADLEEMVAQVHMKTEEIHFGYCTEFMIWLKNSTEPNKHPFSEQIFRNRLAQMGDSLLVVSDEELVKVHVHTENPGGVLELAQSYGSLHRIKIENMREQHLNILKEEGRKKADVPQPAKLPYGLIAVASGSGLAEIFRSLGVHRVIEGGQTMNPSTEDFLTAIRELNAEKVIILPNNSNILMAAKQAAELADVPAAVIPTKSIPQGMAALVAFHAGENLEYNEKAMTDAFALVKTGLITHAVRDTKMGDVQIKEADFIGIIDGVIVTSDRELTVCGEAVLRHLLEETTELVTIFYGSEDDKDQAERFAQLIEQLSPDVEIEVLYGGQPLYPFIFAAE
ncbi:DAK2 domain-containing protein [Brevibacillus fulvus]|uniref:DAK2 domain fusion protein YloV n=1 Tax=Brevibacillus fulvus TaxID=1125967 RepID=A0A939BTF3_9BACL|nr:DAK2 domain fusion protein YloV [Brevibacillus fulvus]